MTSDSVVSYSTHGNNVARYDIRIDWSTSGLDVATNSSILTATAWLRPKQYQGFSGYTCSWYLNINAIRVATGGAKLYDWTTSGADYQEAPWSGSVRVAHGSTGTGTIGITAFFDDTDNTTTFTPKDVTYNISATLDNITRLPQPPITPTITRTGLGTSVSLTTATAGPSGKPAFNTFTTYQYRYGTDNSTWSLGTTSLTSGSSTATGTTVTFVVASHTLSVNDSVTITGASNAAHNLADVRVSATTSTSFTITTNNSAVVNASAISSTGGTATRTAITAGSGSASLSGLTPTSVYYFQTRATNSEGNGGWTGGTRNATITGASSSGGNTTYTILSTVTNPFVVGDVVAVTGASNGGSPASPVGSFNVSNKTITAITSTTFTVANTTNYTFGDGGFVLATSTTASPSGVGYAAPTIASVTTSGTTASVVITPPASNGGSAITSYTVEYSLESGFGGTPSSVTTSGTTAAVTGLIPGRTYYFRAKYLNAAAVTSPYSATVSAFVSAYGRRYATSGSITNVTNNTKVATITSVFGTEFNTDFTTSAAHGFSTGDNVIVSGIAAPYAYMNQTYTNVSVFGANSFSTGANNEGLGTVSISGTATVTGTEVTYTASNQFSANETVTITGVNPGAYNLTNATIKSATASSFVIASSVTGTYVGSTGTASGWVLMLTGQRYVADTGSGSPGWVTINTAQKFTAGAWTPFS